MFSNAGCIAFIFNAEWRNDTCAVIPDMQDIQYLNNFICSVCFPFAGILIKLRRSAGHNKISGHRFHCVLQVEGLYLFRSEP